MKRNTIKYILILAVILIIIFLCRSCAPFYGPAEEEIYTSPEGTNTIVVKYDFVSRPSVYIKGRLRDKKIWDYPNSGFMETVHFNVEWLSENQIRLNYDDMRNDQYDEEYIITIPDY